MCPASTVSVVGTEDTESLRTTAEDTAVAVVAVAPVPDSSLRESW